MAHNVRVNISTVYMQYGRSKPATTSTSTSTLTICPEAGRESMVDWWERFVKKVGLQPGE